MVVYRVIEPIRDERNGKFLCGTVETERMCLKVIIRFAVIEVEIWSDSSLVVVVVNKSRQRVNFAGFLVDLYWAVEEVYCVRVEEGVETSLTF